MQFKFILCLIILLVSGNKLAAQHNNPPKLSTYFNKANPSPAFSSNMANQIIEDEFGFIWIATQDGLNRFDGRRNQIYHNQSTDGMAINANDIKCLAEDRKLHRLWLGSSGGLNAIDTRTGKVVLSFKRSIVYGKSAMPACNTLALEKDKIWIGSFDGLFSLNLSDSTLMNADEGLQGQQAFPLENLVEITSIDKAGRLWVFKTNKGIEIYRLRDGKQIGKYSLHDLGLEDEMSYDRFGGSGFLGNDTICAVVQGGLHAWHIPKPGEVRNVSLQGYQKNSTILSGMYQPNENEIWLYGESKVFLYEKSRQSMHMLGDVNPTISNPGLKDIRNMYKDNEGQLWFANKSGVAIIPSTFPSLFNFHIDVKKGVSLDRIYTLYTENNNYWIGTDKGLYKIKNQLATIEVVDKGVSFWLIDSFIQNSLLISSSNGTKLFKDGKFHTPASFYKELNPLQDEELNSICYSGDSLIVFGSESGRGVFIWNRKINTLRKLEAAANGKSLPSSIINKVYRTLDGNIWIISDEYFSIYQPSMQRLDNYVVRLKKSNTRASVIMDVMEADGKYWLACYGIGLFVLDKQLNVIKVISMPQGLKNTGVYKILPSGTTSLLVTSNNGLFQVNAQTYKVTTLTKANGLQTDEYEEGAAYISGSKILAGGMNGFSAMDTSFLQKGEEIRNVLISGAEIQLKEKMLRYGILENQKLIIPPYYNQVSIFLSDYNFLQPAQSIIQYKIGGLQSEWVDLDNKERITLTGINPGSYLLYARASINGINWVEAKPLALVFQPKWHQTYWFAGLIFITIVSILYGLYRYRLYQIKKENNIRTQIAADLHDDLGSTLTGIKVYSELGTSTGSPEFYAPVKQGLQEASLALREMIWVLDTKTNTVASIIEKLEKNLKPLLQASGIELEVQADSTLENLVCKTDEKRDIYLLLKEFVNNSIKYADCTSIVMKAEVKGKRMQLKISDNGIGFDVNKVQRGNGLGNIEVRAKRSGYHATIFSEPGKGARLTLIPF